MTRKRSVRRPDEYKQANVRNQSSRTGVKPALLVLHTTESHNRPGKSDIDSIINWFDNPVAQSSSHVIVDREGNSARCVKDGKKAWTQAWFNSFCLSIEMIGFASESKTAWLLNERKGLKKVAKYLAHWSKYWDIPLQKAVVSNTGRVVKPGVIRHMDLGKLGGDHHDPGVNFPLDTVIRMAKWYKKFGWY